MNRRSTMHFWIIWVIFECDQINNNEKKEKNENSEESRFFCEMNRVFQNNSGKEN